MNAPQPPRKELTGERFRAAIALHNTGIAMMRQNLRRRYPNASEAGIDQLLKDWLGYNGEDPRQHPNLVPRTGSHAPDAA